MDCKTPASVETCASLIPAELVVIVVVAAVAVVAVTTMLTIGGDDAG